MGQHDSGEGNRESEKWNELAAVFRAYARCRNEREKQRQPEVYEVDDRDSAYTQNSYVVGRVKRRRHKADNSVAELGITNIKVLPVSASEGRPGDERRQQEGGDNQIEERFYPPVEKRHGDEEGQHRNRIVRLEAIDKPRRNPAGR